MPVDQAVWKRPKSRFLEIRQEIFQLFDYDQYAAMVCTALIGWHTSELNQHDKTGQPFDGWITLTQRVLRNSCFGMVSYRKLDDALEVIRSKGVMEMRKPQVRFEGNSYNLNVSLINELLKALPETNFVPNPEDVPSRRNKKYEDVGSASMPKSDAQDIGIYADDTSASMPKDIGIYADDTSASMPPLYKEEVPVVSSLEESIDKPLDFSRKQLFSVISHTWKERLNGNKSVKPKITDMAAAEQVVNSIGIDEFLRKIGPYVARYKYARFEWFLNSFGKMQQPLYTSPADTAVGEPRRDYSEYPRRWSELVAPLEWGANSPGKLLNECCKNPAFQAAFVQICMETKRLHDSGSGDWITFPWILKFDREAGLWNWQKVINGTYSVKSNKQKTSTHEEVMEGALKLAYGKHT